MYRLRKLIREIHRRSVWQVLGVFLVMSWGVLNAVEFLTDFAGLPAWTPMMALVLLLIGLPVVTATAFIQEGIPGLTDDPHEAIHPDEVEGKTPAEVHHVPEAHPMHRSRLFTWRNAVLGGVMAGALLVTTVVAYLSMWALGIGPVGSLVAQGVIAENDPVLLADFENRTDDMTLGAVVTEALAVDLGESEVVTLASQEVVSHALELMGRDPAGTLTAIVARDVAVREGIKAIIEGDVSRVGSRYLLTARIVVPETGDALAGFRETADEEDDLLPAIDRLSMRLRERAGESLRRIRSGAPLEHVTTGSLDALRRYTESLALSDRSDYDAARRLLEEAVAIDTAFAMAHRKLAVMALNRGDDELARSASERAYRHRDRLSDLERYHAEAMFHLTVTADGRRAESALRGVLALDPNDRIALNNLSVQLAGRGLFEEARGLLERAYEGPGASPVAHFNLVEVRLTRRDFAGAMSAQERYEARYPQHIFMRRAQHVIAAASGDPEGAHGLAEAVAADAEAPLSASHAPRYLMAADIASGRVREALGHAEQLTPEIQTRYFARSEVGVGLGAGDVAFWILDDPARVLDDVERLLATIGFERTPAADRLWSEPIITLARAGHAGRARALLDRWTREVDEPRALGRGYRAAHAAVLAAEGAPEGGLEVLATYASERDCDPCGDWVAAPLLEQVGRTSDAIARWERIRDRPMDLGMVLWARTVAAKRLAPLYEAVGDAAGALSAYRHLVGAWAEGDPELQPQVARARARIAELDR